MRCSGTPHSKSFSGRRTAPEGGVSLEAKESSPPSTRALWLFNHFKLPPLGLWPWTKFWNLTSTQQQSSGGREKGGGQTHRNWTSLPQRCHLTLLISLVNANGFTARPWALFSDPAIPLPGREKLMLSEKPCLRLQGMTPNTYYCCYQPGINEIWIMCLKAHMKGIRAKAFLLWKDHPRKCMGWWSSSGQDLSNPKFLGCFHVNCISLLWKLSTVQNLWELICVVWLITSDISTNAEHKKLCNNFAELLCRVSLLMGTMSMNMALSLVLKKYATQYSPLIQVQSSPQACWHFKAHHWPSLGARSHCSNN